jgi:hypothetical protein
MDSQLGLTKIVRQCVAEYDTPGIGSTSFFVADDERKTYAVLAVPDTPRRFTTRAIVMAHLEGDQVVIDEDTTDRPLYEALMHAGIPRERIVLAYAGEQHPATSIEG